MTGKLMFVPDTHVVVPKKLSKNMDDVLYDGRDTNISSDELYSALVAAAPQLTTPSVLRWEGDYLYCFGGILAQVNILVNGTIWWWVNGVWTQACSIDEARRAAEKALGLPEIEEV